MKVNMNWKQALAGLITAMACTACVSAQSKEIRYNFDPEGKTYLRFTLLNQAWVRWNDNNPGSLIAGDPASSTFDIGLRRTRLQLYGQVSDRVFVYTQFGMNNFNALSARKTGTFFHDVTGEYQVDKRALSLGAGLTGWGGMSRFSSPSVSSILAIDAPLFAQATNDVNDQFLRKLSIYAKGKLGKLDYRVAASNPMDISRASAPPPPLSEHSTFYPGKPSMMYHGYLMYQFLDEEANQVAYTTGTYLGTKRVFNIGAGFEYQDKAMYRLSGSDTVRSALALFALDIYYDAPIDDEKGNALSVYAGYFNFDFGKGYLRNLSPLSPADGLAPGTNTLNGPGNGYSAIGTGQIGYIQAGYLFRKNLLGKSGHRLMPYAALTYNDFDRLAQPFMFYDAGMNYLIDGHRSKLTLAYQNRPVINATTLKEDGRKGGVILQYQFSL